MPARTRATPTLKRQADLPGDILERFKALGQMEGCPQIFTSLRDEWQTVITEGKRNEHATVLRRMDDEISQFCVETKFNSWWKLHSTYMFRVRALRNSIRLLIRTEELYGTA